MSWVPKGQLRHQQKRPELLEFISLSGKTSVVQWLPFFFFQLFLVAAPLKWSKPQKKVPILLFFQGH